MNYEDDNPWCLTDDEIYDNEEDKIHHQTLEDQLREVGMSIHDFI
jgi:hypothetical protein